MADKAIKNNVEGFTLIPWAEISSYELNDLKSVDGRDVNKLKNAIVNRGFSFPFYLWAGHKYIIDGAGRTKALRELESEGYAIPDLPVVTIQADSFAEAKTLVLQASSEHGIITQDSLNSFVKDLDVPSILGEINFNSFDLTNLISPLEEPPGPAEEVTKPAVDPDADVKPEEVFITQVGDIYNIGSHVLVCGDSTTGEAYDLLFRDGSKASLVVTDPPYNVDYVGKTKDALKIENDSMNNENFYEFLYDFYTLALAHTVQGGGIYVFHADSEGMNFRKAMTDAGWLLKQCCIWVKDSMVMGRQDYHWQHEPVLYGWAPGESHRWYSDRKQTTVWRFDRPSANREHPTMEPINLIQYPIINSSSTGDIVLDPFGGSGSTMVAATILGRIARLVEKDPRYCDVIVKRMLRCFPQLDITRNGTPIDKAEYGVKKQKASAKTDAK